MKKRRDNGIVYKVAIYIMTKFINPLFGFVFIPVPAAKLFCGASQVT